MPRQWPHRREKKSAAKRSNENKKLDASSG
jgi:hypothetical protein